VRKREREILLQENIFDLDAGVLAQSSRYEHTGKLHQEPLQMCFQFRAAIQGKQGDSGKFSWIRAFIGGKAF
jgi:hypothetical protein